MSPFPPGTPPSCDVVVVNWNAGSQITECLDALASSERDGWTFGQVVVVDNGSTDGSADAALRAGAVLPLRVLCNRVNRGFAAACNQGAVVGAGDYLLFLNPDARPEPDAIGQALGLLETAPDIGVCGVQLLGADGAGISRTCARRPAPRHFAHQMLGLGRLAPRRFPGPVLDEWDHAETRDVDHVMGAFYLIRRPLFERLGGFDERFFVYLEDLDLSARVHDAGFRIVYLAGVRAFHKGGGTSERIKAARLFYALRSRILYGYKYFGARPATLLLLGTLLLEPPIRIAAALARGKLREAGDALRGAGMLWADLPHLLAVARASPPN